LARCFYRAFFWFFQTSVRITNGLSDLVHPISVWVRESIFAGPDERSEFRQGTEGEFPGGQKPSWFALRGGGLIGAITPHEE
jgi:hypothetical protein